MPREAVNAVAANDLAIEKRLKLGKDGLPLEIGEWKVVGVPGLSLVMKPSGVATYFVRFMAGAGARRKQVRQAIGRANGPTAIKLSKAKAQAISIATDGAPATTLRQLFDQFEENDQDRAARTMGDYCEALERDVLRHWATSCCRDYTQGHRQDAH